VIKAGGIVGGAGYAAGQAVTPGSIASIFGDRLAAATASASGSLTTTLGGVQVLVNARLRRCSMCRPRRSISRCRLKLLDRR